LGARGMILNFNELSESLIYTGRGAGIGVSFLEQAAARNTRSRIK